jgi:hypothetical protein
MEEDPIIELLNTLIDTEGYRHTDLGDALEDFEDMVEALLEPVCREFEVGDWGFEKSKDIDIQIVTYTIRCDDREYKVKIYVDQLYIASVPYDYLLEPEE